MRTAFVALLMAASVHCQADLLGNSTAPTLGSGAQSGLKAIFAPLAGRFIGPCTLNANYRVCGRVLADGTPQIGQGFNSCTNWVSSTADNGQMSGGSDDMYSVKLTTSGLEVDGNICTGYGEYTCAGWKMIPVCSISW